MPFGAFTAGRHIAFDDDVLAIAGRVQRVSIRGQRNASLNGNMTEFRPAATSCNSSSNQTEETAGYAYIHGWLVGENEEMADTYKIISGIVDGRAFAGIYSNGTTARGIKVYEGK